MALPTDVKPLQKPIASASYNGVLNVLNGNDSSSPVSPAGPWTFGGAVTFNGSVTFNGAIILDSATINGTLTIVSSSATAFSVGPAGTTNPTFQVNDSVGSQVTGILVAGNTQGNGTVSITATSPGGTAELILADKGSSGSVVVQHNGTTVVSIGSTGEVITITGAGSQSTLQLANGQAAASGVGSEIAFQNTGGTRSAAIDGVWDDGTGTNGRLSFLVRIAGTVTEVVRINSAGTVQVITTNVHGFAVGPSGNNSPAFNVDTSGVGAATFTAVGGAFIQTQQRANGTIGALTTIVNGQTISAINFSAYDGSAYQISSQIEGVSSGAVSSGVVPGALIFFTANTSGVLTESVRIRNDQSLSITSSSANAIAIGPNGQTNASFSVNTSNVSSPIDGISIIGGNASNDTRIIGLGSDANFAITLESKGTGSLKFLTNGASQLQVVNTSSAVNYVTITGGTTGNAVLVYASGSDNNVNIDIISKAAGNVVLSTQASGGVVNLQPNNVNALSIANPAGSPVNYVGITGAITGNGPIQSATGTDSNVTYNFNTKGTGAFTFNTNGTTTTVGTEQFAILHTASAVNYLAVTGNTANNGPIFEAQGSDTAISVNYYTKGAGNHNFYSHAGSYLQHAIIAVSNAVNYFTMQGATTTNSPALDATGSDTNVGMQFNNKGTASFTFVANDINITGTSNGYRINGSYVVTLGSATNVVIGLNMTTITMNVATTVTSTSATSFTVGPSGATNPSFKVDASASSAVTGLSILAQAAGSAIYLRRIGGNTNEDFHIQGNAINDSIYLDASNGHVIAQFSGATALITSFTFTGGATGVSPLFGVAGTDTNIGMTFQVKGSGNYLFNLSTSGNLQFLGASSNSKYARINSSGGLEILNSAYSAVLFAISDAGAITAGSLGTTASAANAFFDGGASNNFLRSTSSRSYKDNIQTLTLLESQSVIFELNPVKYNSKSKADDPKQQFVGLIAEEVAELDSRFITKKDGKPDWVQYPMLIPPLVRVVQDHETRIKALEAKVGI